MKDSSIDINQWAVFTTTSGRRTLGVPLLAEDRVIEAMSNGEAIQVAQSLEFSAEFMVGQNAHGQQVMQRVPMTTTRDFLTDNRVTIWLIAQEVYFLSEAGKEDQAKYKQFIESALKVADSHRLNAMGLVTAPVNGVKLGG